MTAAILAYWTDKKNWFMGNYGTSIKEDEIPSYPPRPGSWNVHDEKVEILAVLQELDYAAWQIKREQVRRRDEAGELQWQKYRDALIDVANKLNIDFHPEWK